MDKRKDLIQQVVKSIKEIGRKESARSEGSKETEQSGEKTK